VEYNEVVAENKLVSAMYLEVHVILREVQGIKVQV
jgi:hypothetical protein